MNWEAVAAVSEAIGVLALIVSIAYLALEVRLSRIESRKQAFEGYIGFIFGWFSKISTDADTARLYCAGQKSLYSLSEEDQIRFSHLMFEKFGCIELLREYDKYKLGKSESIGRIPGWITSELSHQGVREWWENIGSRAMAKDFVEYVNSFPQKNRNGSNKPRSRRFCLPPAALVALTWSLTPR